MMFISDILEIIQCSLVLLFNPFIMLSLSPFSPAKAPNIGELCNPITRQAIELESYPNHPRIQQVL